MLKERKHLELAKQSLWFLSLFQNLVRPTLYLCSQKINSVLLWERTRTRFTACRQFAVSRTTTSCSSRTERHARHSPHCRLPAFQCAWVYWTRKLAVEQSRSKSRGLFSVDSVVADGVTSQKFRHWSAEASSDRLLGSAKPIHTESSCQKDWWLLSRQRVVMLNFVWTNGMLEIVLVLLYFE